MSLKEPQGKINALDGIMCTWELDNSCSEQLCRKDRTILLESPNCSVRSDTLQFDWSIKFENVIDVNGTINNQYIKLIFYTGFRIPHYSVTLINKKENEIVSSHEIDRSDGSVGIPFKRNLIIDEHSGNLLGDKLVLFFHITLCKDLIDSYKKHKLASKSKTQDSATRNLAQRLKELDYLEHLLNDRKFSDVTLKVNDKVSFYAHKAILSSRSPVFDAMFSHEMKEKMTNSVEINDADPQSFGEMLRFIYTGKVNDIGKHAFELLTLADMYSIEGLKSLCTEAVKDKITVENALTYLSHADNCNAEELKDEVVRFIVENRILMLNRPEYPSTVQNFSPRLVFELLKALSLRQ